MLVLKGFCFGMILQIAIGPVCLYVFKTANEVGLRAAEAAVIAATIVDILFVTLAIAGISELIEKPKMKMLLKYFGSSVLLYFGIGTILEVCGVKIIPTLISSGSESFAASNAFVTSFVLTAASPLSILFWSGVFAGKLAEESFSRKEMISFGIGAVSATLIFLGIFAYVVWLFRIFISPTVTQLLNLLVGLIIIGFGTRLAVKKV